MPTKPRAIAHNPLDDSEIMKEFYRPSTPRTGKKPAVADGRPDPGVPALVKATFYLAPEDIIALEELQLAVRKREGRKANKSELVRESIALLIKNYEK
jgi:hypothetical protein